MRMPEAQSGIREDRLRLRRCLQVRPCLHLQALVSNSNRAAYCALGTGADTRRRLETGKDTSNATLRMVPSTMPLFSSSRRCFSVAKATGTLKSGIVK